MYGRMSIWDDLGMSPPRPKKRRSRGFTSSRHQGDFREITRKVSDIARPKVWEAYGKVKGKFIKEKPVPKSNKGKKVFETEEGSIYGSGKEKKPLMKYYQ